MEKGAVRMRDVTIMELGIREVSNHCEFADIAYGNIDKSGHQEAVQTFFYIHSFLAHCGTVAHILWSPDFAAHSRGQTIAQILNLPGNYRIEEETVREIIDRYDHHLAGRLASCGEVAKILDYNIGDRDSFEEESSFFLRHYDPTVDTFTLMEEEFHLQHIWAELADVRNRAEQWLKTNSQLIDRPASAGIPPVS